MKKTITATPSPVTLTDEALAHLRGGLERGTATRDPGRGTAVGGPRPPTSGSMNPFPIGVIP